MKSLSLISTGTLCVALFACSTAAQAPADTMASAAGSGNSSGAGAGVSGATGVSGAATTGASGSSSIAGTSSMGGAPAAGSGGSVELGGAPTTTGGSASVAGAGGAPAGGATTTAGAGGAAGGASGVGTTLVGDWDGALLEYPCAKASTSGYDCANVNCSGTPSTTTHTKSWTMGGTAGTVYNVTFRVRGVVEVTYYDNTLRDADVANGNMNTSITKSGDLFARGGTAQTSSGQSYDYNTYQLDVTPAVSGAENTYYLNAVDKNENPHAGGSTTTHLTFKIDYTKTIKVTGGGTVTLKSFDSNCALVMNCSTSSQNQCATHSTVDITGATPAPAPIVPKVPSTPETWQTATFAQPYSQNNGYGQWLLFDITDVSVAQ